jgi:pimeloyl-ACP methyl ester carboxylesterase
VVSLAGVVDLQRAWELHLSHDAVVDFLGGTPGDVPQRYRDASPAEIAVAGAQRLVHGTLDDTVPVEMSREYSKKKQARREDVHLLELPTAGHFDLIDPASPSWSRVEQTVMSLIA